MVGVKHGSKEMQPMKEISSGMQYAMPALQTSKRYFSGLRDGFGTYKFVDGRMYMGDWKEGCVMSLLRQA